ncbi:MAG: YceI family protein [Flavisolibacter sp.]
MLKNFLFVVGLIAMSVTSQAQDKYFTKTGKIEFSSRASMEDIDAKNKTVAAILDTKTGALQFSALMKGFEFPKALMQEHFNENYVESDKYPKAEFKGSVTNNANIDYTKDGTYTAQVSGQLTIHGVTKNINTTGSFKVDGGKIDANAVFNVLVSDYKIKIPSIVKDKVSNTIKVTVDCRLEPLK